MNVQGFSGGTLVRSISGEAHIKEIILRSLSTSKVSVLLVSDRCVCVNPTTKSIIWHTLEDLRKFGLNVSEAGDCLIASPPNGGGSCDLFYLGSSSEPSSTAPTNETQMKNHYYFVADIKSSTYLSQLFSSEQLKDLRSVMLTLAPGDLSIAGHAVSLSQWHRTHRFCPQCGSKTKPIALGTKRICLSGVEDSTSNHHHIASATPPPIKIPQQYNRTQHKLYPRIDPVIIALIHNNDNTKCLLGRSRNIPILNMLTCLSGFIEYGESIEEAVVREVKEESGVNVDIDSIKVLGSQPWPLGRGGSHELMIGCIGIAKNEDLDVDYDEMAECRWVDRCEIVGALDQQRYFGSGDNNNNKNSGGGGEMNEFVIPPPVAIANQLMKIWVEGSGRNLKSNM